MEQTFSIKEAAKISGKSTTTIYRYIKNEKLPATNIGKNGKANFRINKVDLENVFGKTIEESRSAKANMAPSRSFGSDIKSDFIKKEEFEIILEKAFSTYGLNILKSFEKELLYESGKIREENSVLKGKIDNLVDQNLKLREKINNLPDQNINQKLENLEKDIKRLHEENINLMKENKELRCSISDQKRLKEENEELWDRMERKAKENRELKKELDELPASPHSLKEVLLNNAENMYALQKQKQHLENKLKEKERQQKKLEDKYKIKLENFKASWWKKLFSS